MKKKSLFTMLGALALVGSIGVGSTLAYLSSTTEVMTNTFSVGKVSVKQDESDESTEDETDRTTEGNTYTDITPGDVLVKDPTATVIANSADCYVFMQLSGADELAAQDFAFEGFDSTKWIKVADEDNDTTTTYDGVYRYASIVTKSATDTKLPALFTSVTYSIDATELAENVTLSDVTVKTCAVQADNMTVETALTAAQAEMAK